MDGMIGWPMWRGQRWSALDAGPDPDERVPLPPGHPITWGAITAGTVLSGAVYPYPVFDADPAEGDLSNGGEP